VLGDLLGSARRRSKELRHVTAAHPSVAIEGLFDVPVAATELVGAGDPSALIGDEVERAVSMGDKRQREFAAGRTCARLAMHRLGCDGEAQVTSSGRAPRWPEGLVGSISHTRGYCAAVVARTVDTGGAHLGLDVEHLGRIKPNLWRRIFVAAERDDLERRAASADADRANGVPDADTAATTIFSVKEALYKAQFPITESWVGFEDVRVELGTDGAATLHRETALPVLDALAWPVRGRWLVADGRVVTAVTLTPV